MLKASSIYIYLYLAIYAIVKRNEVSMSFVSELPCTHVPRVPKDIQ